MDEKRSMQASIVGSIRSLESRNLEERNHEMAATKIPNLVNDLSDMLDNSSLDMTESPREDVDQLHCNIWVTRSILSPEVENSRIRLIT